MAGIQLAAWEEATKEEDRNYLKVIQLLEDNPGTGRYSRFQMTGVIERVFWGKEKFGN